MCAGALNGTEVGDGKAVGCRWCEAKDDFAFGTREGLLPVTNRQGDNAFISFNFELQQAGSQEDEGFSARQRAAA